MSLIDLKTHLNNQFVSEKPINLKSTELFVKWTTVDERTFCQLKLVRHLVESYSTRWRRSCIICEVTFQVEHKGKLVHLKLFHNCTQNLIKVNKTLEFFYWLDLVTTLGCIYYNKKTWSSVVFKPTS